jgi:hypothetical protein
MFWEDEFYCISILFWVWSAMTILTGDNELSQQLENVTFYSSSVGVTHPKVNLSESSSSWVCYISSSSTCSSWEFESKSSSSSSSSILDREPLSEISSEFWDSVIVSLLYELPFDSIESISSSEVK